MGKGKINIRAITENDLDKISIWNSEEFRGEYQDCELDSLAKMKRKFNETAFFTDEFQMLMVTSENERIGLVYLNFIRTGLVRIGVVLDSTFRYKGVGSEVVNIVCEYLFSNYAVERIDADTDVENKAAQRILEKAGFEQEGRLKKYRYHHGKYNDSFMYSKIRETINKK